MLFERQKAEAAEAASVLGSAFRFDWDGGCYEADGGQPSAVTGKQAVIAWLEQMLRVPKGRYGIFPDAYGTDMKAWLGKKFNSYYSEELKRQVETACRLCPGIEAVTDWDWDGGIIRFSVRLAEGVEPQTNGSVTGGGSLGVTVSLTEEAVEAVIEEVFG